MYQPFPAAVYLEKIAVLRAMRRGRVRRRKRRGESSLMVTGGADRGVW